MFVLKFALMTLMCHLNEMKLNTVQFFFSFHTTEITKYILNTVNAKFKIMEITKFINKSTTNLYIYRKCDIVHKTLGQLNNLL